MDEAFDKWLKEEWPGLVDSEIPKRAAQRLTLYEAFLAGAGWGIETTGNRVLTKIKGAGQ